MKKRILSLLLVMVFVLAGCQSSSDKSEDKTTIIYGKAAGPYTVLFEDAIIPIFEKKKVNQFKCIEFSDLLQNDTALNEGEIDVNVEQHTAYMKNFNESQDGDLVALTAIPTVPAGIFSNTHKSLEEIKKGR